MMPGMPVRWLLALNLALVGGLGYLWLTPEGQPRDLRWVPPAPVLPEATAHTMAHAVGSEPDLQAFAQVVERPLFSPTRRPPPPPKPPAPPPPPDPLANVHVYGIFVGEEAGEGGMLASIDGKVRRMGTNDEVAGWKIKELREREITLVKGEETRVLRLVQARPVDATRTARAAGAPANAARPGGPAPGANPAADAAAERRRRVEEVRARAGMATK
jgi:hypothetical protein